MGSEPSSNHKVAHSTARYRAQAAKLSRAGGGCWTRPFRSVWTLRGEFRRLLSPRFHHPQLAGDNARPTTPHQSGKYAVTFDSTIDVRERQGDFAYILGRVTSKDSELKIPFRELLRRINITGISTVFGGVDWTVSRADKDIVREVITRFEDRRALYADREVEFEGQVIDSVMIIRETLRACLI